MANTTTNADPEAIAGRLRLIVADPADLHEPRGRLRLGANPLRMVDRARGLPNITIRCAVPQEDGSAVVYGDQSVHNEPNSLWRIMRCRTWDGVHYEPAETVFTSERGHWYGSTAVARNGVDGSFLCLKWGPAGGEIREKGGHAVWAFGSPDGRQWRRLQERPVYHDHDAFSLTWDPASGQYVTFQATYQTWPEKPYRDNAGAEIRRVMHVRTSPDGVHWTPSEDIMRLGRHIPDADMIVPDEEDAPETEFYRFTGFPYADRYVGMMQHYCPVPRPVEPERLHGPHCAGEWWVGRGVRQWQRPYRDVFAPGPADTVIHHAPIDLQGMHLWVVGRNVYGLPLNRLFFAGALANAEFSTRLFTCPGRLALNASFNFHEDPARGFRNQSYLMVEIRDEQDKVIEGFAREQCLLRSLPGDLIPLHWGDPQEKHGTSRLQGRRIRLRFYLRDARVYAVTNA